MMAVTREELAAWVDNEIEGARALEIAAAVESDPQLQRDAEAHRALKAKLGAHFAPLLEQEVPERLSGMLRGRDKVVDLAAARERRQDKRRTPRWSWIAGPALAASVALAVILPGGGADQADGYAEPQLAAALDTQLAGEEASEGAARILLSFRNEEGEFCRAFGGAEASGIACRDAEGWRLAATAGGVGPARGEFRQAGNSTASIMEQAQDMAAGPALDAGEEEAARAAGWR